jgi:hypothetical protein
MYCATGTIMECFEYTSAERNELTYLLRATIKLRKRWVDYAEKLAARLHWDIHFFRAVENETRQLIMSILGEEDPTLHAKSIKSKADRIFRKVESYLKEAIDAHESLEAAKKDAEAWDVPLEAARAMREEQKQRDKAFKRSAAIAAAEVEEIKKELLSEEAEAPMPPEPKKPRVEDTTIIIEKEDQSSAAPPSTSSEAEQIAAFNFFVEAGKAGLADPSCRASRVAEVLRVGLALRF